MEALRQGPGGPSVKAEIILPDAACIPPAAFLDLPVEVLVIDPDQSHAAVIPPFIVIEERPDVIAFQVDAVGQGAVAGFNMLVDVFGPAFVMDLSEMIDVVRSWQ